MKKLFVSDLMEKEGEFEDIFYIHSLKNSIGRRGEYVELIISDKTGDLKAYLFDKEIEIKEGIFKIKGEVGVHQDEKRVILKGISIIEITPDLKRELIKSSEIPRDELRRKILQKISIVQNTSLRKILENIFKGEFFEDFLEAPAAMKYHHAYIGGLAEHTINVCEIAVSLSNCYPSLNKDLLITGALLHDIGKVFSYKFDLKSEMTDEGKLLDHIYLGMKRIDEEIDKINSERDELFKSKFPEDLRLNLLHLIASHHGTKGQGALTEPLTKEAFVLYFADQLDAEMFKYEEAIKMTQEGERWSPYHTRLRKSVFIGGDIEDD